VEREFRESSDMRRSVAGLALVLGVGAVLRFWALGYNIPFAVGIDEPQVMNRVVHMMKAGSLNPEGFFDYPTLYFYLQLVVACARFIAGAQARLWTSLGQVSADDFYLWGRVLTATLGTATIYLVYRIGFRWGSRHALLAAGLMAVIPNHVRESHHVLTDVPMTFFTTLSFLLALGAMEQPTARAFAWAGAAAGLAAGTKYYGGLVLVVPLLAAWFVANPPRPRHVYLLSAVGAAAGCFLLAAPYTLLDLPGFLNGFARVTGMLQPRGGNVEPGWITYLKHLNLSLWYPGMILLLWGAIHALVRAIIGPGKSRFALLIIFPVLYFFLVADRVLVWARYLMPLFPFISLLIAIAIVSGVSLLRRFSIPRPVRTALIIGLTVVAILPPLVGSIRFDLMAGKQWTYAQAYSWILKNVPAQSSIVIETGGLSLPGARYQTRSVTNVTENPYEWYVERKVQYIVTSSMVGRSAAAEPAYRSLLGRMSLVAGFRQSDEHPGPDLQVFRLAPEEPAPMMVAAPAVPPIKR
jgi:4-amino-4-deoxy-L-arabinose transferase-like glycosyltransferase